MLYVNTINCTVALQDLTWISRFHNNTKGKMVEISKNARR